MAVFKLGRTRNSEVVKLVGEDLQHAPLQYIANLLDAGEHAGIAILESGQPSEGNCKWITMTESVQDHINANGVFPSVFRDGEKAVFVRVTHED